MLESLVKGLLGLAFLTGVFGEPLSVLENEQIQQICGAYNEHHIVGNKVLFGTKTESNEAPWAIPIAVHRGDGKMYCSATLISPRHLITARHCFVHDFKEGSYKYVFDGEVIDLSNCRGEDYIVPPEKRVADIHFATRCRDDEACELINLDTTLITRKPAMVVLPGVCSASSPRSGHDDDIAIVEIDEDVLFSEKIHPACVDFNGYGKTNRASVKIYGFGYDPSDERIKTGILKYEDSHIYPCNYEARVVCTYSDNEQQLACKGDSGGGGVREADGRIRLITVLSRGEPCEVGKKKVMDIHMSVYYYSREICKYTGVCEMETTGRMNVAHLYGQERGKSKLESSGFNQIFHLKHSLFFLALFLL